MLELYPPTQDAIVTTRIMYSIFSRESLYKPSFVTGILGGGVDLRYTVHVGRYTMFGIWRGDVMVLDSAFCERNAG